MKTLVIENQYEVDQEILAFIDDNEELFSEVKTVRGSIYRKPEELLEYLKEHEALIIASTFMHKEQLEDMTEGIAKLEGKKLFIHRFENKLEEWFDDDNHFAFFDWGRFKINLQCIFDRHEVYSFYQDWENKDIRDEHWEKMEFADKSGRGKFEYEEIKKP